VKPERSRGLQLYALAAALLIGAVVWFIRAAPYVGADPRVLAWQATVVQALPDVQPQVGSDMVMIGAGALREARAPVDGGSFTLTMVCAGVGGVRVRLSAVGSNDTGRAVPCADAPQAVSLTVGLGSEFYLSMEAETTEAVFRWRLTPATTY
jgi:Family of unknown function (DUF6023)